MVNNYYQLTATLYNSTFYKNIGDDALIYICGNSIVTIQNSLFRENHSIGRGSVIFSEKRDSIAIVNRSIFQKNYAI